jgi:hypothetical protein
MTPAEVLSKNTRESEPPLPCPCGAEAISALPPRLAAVAPAGAARRYLHDVLAELTAAPGAALEPPAEPSRLPELVFRIQTRREFCYLSGTRVARYREAAVGWIGHCAGRGEPLRYCLDIGGGYHASLRPDVEPPSFDAGLGELLLLRQIRRFDAQVRRIYPPGVHFTLVIDNLVARLVNDTPVAHTAAYCARLRALIDGLGLASLVELWVESEHLSVEDFERLRSPFRVTACADGLTAKEHETVARFLGRSCDAAEAAERQARYREIIAISARLIDSRVRGLRMTQRATEQTICFRPFPGADSRIQSGQVALRIDPDGSASPVLLTSHNQHHYDWCRVDFSDMLPAAIEQVICADPAVRPQN